MHACMHAYIHACIHTYICIIHAYIHPSINPSIYPYVIVPMENDAYEHRYARCPVFVVFLFPPGLHVKLYSAHWQSSASVVKIPDNSTAKNKGIGRVSCLSQHTARMRTESVKSTDPSYQLIPEPFWSQGLQPVSTNHYLGVCRWHSRARPTEALCTTASTATILLQLTSWFS